MPADGDGSIKSRIYYIYHRLYTQGKCSRSHHITVISRSIYAILANHDDDSASPKLCDASVMLIGDGAGDALTGLANGK